jgi:hypothetical protein
MKTLFVTPRGRVRFAAAVLGGLFATVAAAALAAPVTVDDALSFSTAGQGLFAPGGSATERIDLRFLVLDHHASSTHGAIVRTPAQVPVYILQNIWQTAINKCLAASYTFTVPVTGQVVRIGPTQQECITGVIDRCIIPDPLGGACLFRVVHDIGAEIGPKPTQPITRPYDIGVAVTSFADLELGFAGVYQHDLGSVDVTFTSAASVTVSDDNPAPGSVVTVRTSHVPRQPYVMASRYPFIDVSLKMLASANIGASLRYAGIDQTNGAQIDRTTALLEIDTRDNPAGTNGVVPFTTGSEELFGVRLGASGFERRLFGTSTAVTNELEEQVTIPFNPPAPPAKEAPRTEWPVSFSLLDLRVSAPKLDTPAAPQLQCGDCVPLRNFISGDGTLVNTTPLGTRTLIGGITDGDGWTLPLLSDGHEDVDLARIDLDTDVITLAAGVPLGANVDIIPLVVEAEVNLLDLDIATFLSVDQRLQFDSNLQVEIRFSVPTDVMGPGETAFTTVTTKLIRVGDSLEFRQPAADLRITPVYTLRANRFTNDTKLKFTTAVQETIAQVKLSGFIPEFAAQALGQKLNFALLQLTPELHTPATIAATDVTPWALGGFSDAPGTSILVRAQAPAGGGGGGGSGAGGSSSSGAGGSSSSGAGGGGGTLDLASLLALGLLALGAQGLRRQRAGAVGSMLRTAAIFQPSASR